MAKRRKRIEDEERIKNWDDVDLTLKELAELEGKIEKLEVEMNDEISDLKLDYQDKFSPLLTKIKDLGKDLKKFVKANRGDLGAKKSRESIFGKVGFRKSTSITIPRGTEEAIVNALKARKMMSCIITKENVNRDVLVTCDDHIIEEVGAVKNVKNTFWYETARESLDTE